MRITGKGKRRRAGFAEEDRRVAGRAGIEYKQLVEDSVKLTRIIKLSVSIRKKEGILKWEVTRGKLEGKDKQKGRRVRE